MTKHEYMAGLANYPIDQKKVDAVQKKYGAKLPETVQKLISGADGPVFLDGSCRVLSFEEIMDADDIMHMNFTVSGIVPLVDCYDNDFIVYHIPGDCYSMFNIVDACDFMECESLEELMT